MWLETSSTNNCPKAIASYFLDYVVKNGGEILALHVYTFQFLSVHVKNNVITVLGTARIIRGDCGNENLNVAGVQRFYRCNGTDSMAGEKSFLFGKSTSNQVPHLFFSKKNVCFKKGS